MTVGRRLKEERERLSLTQSVIADVAGTTKQTQYDYENNKTSPTARYLDAVRGLGIDVLYVITGNRNPNEKLSNSRTADAVAKSVIRKKIHQEKVKADNDVAFSVPSEAKPFIAGKDHSVDYDELTQSDKELMGKRIRFERQMLRLRVGAMASMCNVSEETWQKYESGELPIDRNALHQFTFLGGDLLYIMTGIRDLYTSKNMTESRLLMDFREIPVDRKRIILDCVQENLYQDGDDDLPQEKRGGLRISPISD